MSSAARKPQPTDDSPETAPALAVAPKTRQRHDPTAKAQAALDRAQVQVKALHDEIRSHEAKRDSANNKLKLALQHREYLAMHPLLQPQDAGDFEPATDDDADLSTP